MSATREQILKNAKFALDQLLTELNAMKASICVLLTYVEQEMCKHEWSGNLFTKNYCVKCGVKKEEED